MEIVCLIVIDLRAEVVKDISSISYDFAQHVHIIRVLYSTEENYLIEWKASCYVCPFNYFCN